MSHWMSGMVMIPLEKLLRHGLVSANNCTCVVRLLDYNSCAGHERAIGRVGGSLWRRGRGMGWGG